MYFMEIKGKKDCDLVGEEHTGPPKRVGPTNLEAKAHLSFGYKTIHASSSEHKHPSLLYQNKHTWLLLLTLCLWFLPLCVFALEPPTLSSQPASTLSHAHSSSPPSAPPWNPPLPRKPASAPLFSVSISTTASSMYKRSSYFSYTHSRLKLLINLL